MCRMTARSISRNTHVAVEQRTPEMTKHSACNGENYLLAALPPADLSLIKPHLREMRFERGVSLQEPGAEINHVYFPHSGMISLLVVMPEGEAIETATIGREGVVGAMSGLGPRHAFTGAIVQVTGTTSRIATSRFRTAVKQSDVIREVVLRYNDLLLGQVQQLAACNALHGVEARLCRWLLQTRDCIDSDTIPLTQEFLAQMLGAGRTTVTLTARKLQAMGLIRYRRGRIDLLDPHRLEETACACYEIVRRQIDQNIQKH
jgi:CRP-like cAMP-binding protein